MSESDNECKDISNDKGVLHFTRRENGNDSKYSNKSKRINDSIDSKEDGRY